MPTPICIYHGNCADGFGAAWAVWKRFPDWEFYPGVYQDPPPDVAGRDVVLVDFSYKRPVLLQMGQVARSVLILDHHKSAMEDLAGFTAPHNWQGHMKEAKVWREQKMQGCFPRAKFDMGKSGAVLAWEYFHPGKPVPALLLYIQDRDLWRFELEGTREIQAAIFSYEYSFQLYNELVSRAEYPDDRETLKAEGAAIERKHFKDIHELLEVCQRPLTIGGQTVPAASLPYTLASDAGHIMCRDCDEKGANPPFAACYWDTPDGRVFSLRSDDDYGAADVSEVAKLYGGGGHKNAAGFRVPFDRLLADGSPALDQNEVGYDDLRRSGGIGDSP